MNWLRAIWGWFDDRTGLTKLVSPLVRHPVPPGTNWLYVFGSATLLAFIIQVATGVALATAYVSAAGSAYDSLRFITHDAPLGRLLRGMHYFGASAMVLLIGMHAIRVFLTASYKYPREMSWVSGVFLLGLTLLMGFTGQLLRWDQNAVWSVVVGSEQAGRTPLIGNWLAHFVMGGGTVGSATLSRFFAVHVFITPALIFAIVGFHIYLIIHTGISELPRAGHPVDPKTYRAWYEDMIKREGQPFWPAAAWRDAIFALVVILTIFLLALIVGPPELGKPPNPAIIEADPRPDWYLLWYFAVLALLPHGTEGWFIIWGPLLAAIILLALPFIFNKGERAPSRRPWALAVIFFIVVMVGTLWVAGVRADWSPDFSAKPLSAQVIGATSGPVFTGGDLFYRKGCLFCHAIQGDGGRRGPNLTYVGQRLVPDQLTIRIVNGGYNMPAYGGNLKPEELQDLVTFLASRQLPKK